MHLNPRKTLDEGEAVHEACLIYVALADRAAHRHHLYLNDQYDISMKFMHS